MKAINRGKCRALTAAIIILVLLFSSTATDVSAAAIVKAGQTGKSYGKSLAKGSDGKVYYTPGGSRLSNHGVYVGGTLYTTYCMDYYKPFYNQKRSYTAYKYSSTSRWTSLSAAKKRSMAAVMLYGYNMGKPAPYGNTSDYYAATQALIWEIHAGHTYVSATGSWTDKTNKIDDMISGRTNALKNYTWIKKQVTAHLAGAPFLTKSSSSAKTYTLKYNYSTGKFSTKLTDSNSGNYLKKTSPSALAMSRSGHNYTFSASKAGSYTAVLKNNKSFVSQPLLVLNPANSSYQSLIMGATDITNYYVKFKTEAKGTAQIKKTSDDGKVSGFTFNVKCAANGYNANHTTGPTGMIALNLYPGTYTVTEVLTAAQKAAGYAAPAAKKITVTSSKTSAITMHNKRNTGTAKIIKTSDTGVVQGFTFRIKSSDGTYNKTFTTNASGTITASIYPGTYTVTEILTIDQLEAGYKTANPSTVTIKAGQTKEIRIHNEVVPFLEKVRIIKSTSDEGPVAGFRFKITGIHSNSRAATADGILALAAPSVTGMDDYDIGPWILDADSEAALRQMNEDAEAAKTGTYELTYKAAATLKESSGTGEGTPDEGDEGTPDEGEGPPEEEPKDEAMELAITVKATLDKADRETKAGQEQTDGSGSVTYKDVTWAGAATTYEGEGVTDVDGYFEQDDLDLGTYTVTEILTDEQKLRYRQPQSRTIRLLTEGQTGTVVFENTAKQTPVRIKKHCIDGNISGIEFRITGKTAWGEEITPATATTDDEGNIDILLYGGTYTIEETGLDPAIYIKQPPVVITLTGEEESVEIPFTNVPHAGIAVSKKSLTTSEELPGAVLQILDAETEEVLEEWISGDVPHMVEGLARGKGYILREAEAPEGYAAAEDIHFTAGESETVEMIDKPTSLFITKIDEKDGAFLPGAEFEILAGDTNESVCRFEIIEEDGVKKAAISRAADGIASSDNGRTAEEEEETGETLPEELRRALFMNHNAAGTAPASCLSVDPAIPGPLHSAIPESREDDGEQESAWGFSDGMYASINGLSEGKEYILRETAAPEGYTAAEDLPFTFTDQMKLEIANATPALFTTAHDAENGTKISRADKSVTIVDTVNYQGVAKGGSYTLTAALMKKDGTPLLNKEGKPVTASMDFVPEGGEGTIDITLPAFDGSEMDGQKVVVFESLTHEGGEIASHADLESAEQTVTLIEEIGYIEMLDDDELKKLLYSARTGDDAGGIAIACVLLLLASAGILCTSARRKENTENESK